MSTSPFLDRFEEAWQTGDCPDLAAFLPEGPDRADAARELALIDLERRIKAGVSARVEQYTARFPELGAPDIRAELIACEVMYRRRRERDISKSEFLRRFPDTPEEVEAAFAVAPLGDSEAPEFPGLIPVEKLGTGAMGVVYKALDVRLRRYVAVKVLIASGATDVARFRAEGEAVARLEHENIVRVHRFDEHAGRDYLVMEFCEGGSLDQRIKQLTFDDAAALLEKLARAMERAHREEVVHRDLKPANILLTGEGVPKVADFGLARREDETRLTATGATVGTPAYMAPEQATGSPVGPAADVWSLGVVLYECLAGRVPFDSTDVVTLAAQVRDQDPPPFDRAVPRDLGTICLKCLRKDPADRYAAAELAAELRRYLDGEPIRARRMSPGERLARRVRRHPRVTAGIVAGLLVAVVGGYRLTAANSGREVEALRGSIARDIAADGLTLRTLPERLAKVDESLRRLAEASPGDVTELSGSWWRTVAEVCSREIVAARRAEDLDGLDAVLERLDAASPGESFRLRRERDLHLRADWAKFPLPPDLFPDRVAADEGVWRLSSGPPGVVVTSVESDGPFEAEVAFDLAGSSGHSFGLRLDAAEVGEVRSLALWGKRVALGHAEGRVAVWDVQSGLPSGDAPGQGDRPHSLAFSPDGSFLAVAERDGVRVSPQAGGEALRIALPGWEGGPLVFSPDGRVLAVGVGSVRLFDSERGNEIRRFDGHVGRVNAVAFRPDLVVSVGEDGTMWAWPAAGGAGRVVFRSAKPLTCVALAPVGGAVAVGGADGDVTLCDTDGKGDPVRIAAGVGEVAAVDFAPGGATLVAAGKNGVAICDIASRGVVLLPLSGATVAAFSPDGANLYVGFRDGTGMVWDLVESRERGLLDAPGYAVVARPAGGRIVVTIFRDGLPLARGTVQVPEGGPISLSVRRDGPEVSAQVTRGRFVGDRLLFRDDAAFGRSSGGRLAVDWPTGARVTRVEVRRKIASSGGSPLSKGDDAFTAGRVGEALDFYRESLARGGRTPAEVEVRREARFKQAVCELALGRGEEAEVLFQSLVDDGGEGWPMVAAFRLWALYLDRGDSEAANGLFHATIRPRYPAEAAAASVSEAERQHLRDRYGGAGSKRDFYLQPGRFVEEVVPAVEALEYLGATPRERHSAAQRLIEGFWLAGREADARALAARLLEEARGLPFEVLGPDIGSRTIDRHGWLSRAAGDWEASIREVDFFLNRVDWKRPGREGARQMLLLERCRADIAAGKFADALADLRRFDAEREASRTPYNVYAAARMIEGFLRLDLNSATEARKAWAAGTYAAWSGGADDGTLGPEDRARDLMLQALAGRLDDAGLDRALDRATQEVTENLGARGNVLRPMLALGRMRAGEYRALAASPRGIDCMRKLAYQTISFPDCFRIPAALLFAKTIESRVAPGGLEDEVGYLLLDIGLAGYDSFQRGEISVQLLAELGAMWALPPAIADRRWEAVSAKLPPVLCAGAAFVFGLKFSRQGSGPAARLLKEAVRLSPGDARMRRLAQAEADRSGKR